MLLRKSGLNKAAIASVETTTANWGCCSWPVRARKSACDRRDATEVDQRERGGKRAVDQGAVYDHVYVVEAVSQDGEPDSGRHPA